MTEPIQKVQKLLDSADRAFDANDMREGSRLMWEAARTSIAAVAASHGWPSDSLDEIKDVIFRLDGIDENGNFQGKYPKHLAHFGVADGFREHAETDEWEYPEFQWGEAGFRTGRKSVKKFVALLLDYADSETKSI